MNVEVNTGDLHIRKAIKMARDLTDRQEEVLRYLVEFTLDNHYQPSVREMGAELGINSTNGVKDHLRGLERKGWIKMTNKARAIIIFERAIDKYKRPEPLSEESERLLDQGMEDIKAGRVRRIKQCMES